MRVLLVIAVASFSYAQQDQYERARQMLIAGKAADAAKIYRELSRAQPDNADLLLNLTIAEYKAGDFRESADTAAAALKLKPDLLPARLFLGASYLELGSYAEAVEPLTLAVNGTPGDRNARLMLAEALLGAGRPAEAVERFRAAAEVLPDNPRVWAGLARAYEKTGDKELAQKAWSRLMALPPSVESHVRDAERNNAALRWRDASKEWREALNMAPNSGKLRLGLAWSEFRSRNYESAIATLAPMLPAFPSAEVQFLYGASLLNLQKPAEALPYIKAALKLDPKFLPARAAMGQALLQTGNPEQAIPLLKDALGIDQDGSTHFQLFRAYQLTHREDDAKQALADYRRIRASAH